MSCCSPRRRRRAALRGTRGTFFRLLTRVQVLDIELLWKLHMQLFAKLDVFCYQRSEHLASARAQALYMVIDMLRKKAAVARGARQRGAYGVRAGLWILHDQPVQHLDRY